MSKIVLTGGPGAGKTALLDLLVHEFSHDVYPVAEAASILYKGGFPRSDLMEHRKAEERAIYFVQKELEHIGSLECGDRFLLCDRGSLDGLAYWPGDQNSFFQDLKTTRQAELDRYDWVIHLKTVTETPSSWLRIEPDSVALEIGQRLLEAWKGHPRRFVIDDSHDFLDTTRRLKQIVGGIVTGKNAEEIRNMTSQRRPTRIPSMETTII